MADGNNNRNHSGVGVDGAGSGSSRFSRLTLLNRSATVVPAAPSPGILECFDNQGRGRDYLVSFRCPEFTSLCPVTGQPDFGAIRIRYVPDKLCVESKSLKLYLFSFRSHQAFHEEVVNVILDAVVAACAPKWGEVCGRFNPRGGIAIDVYAATGAAPAWVPKEEWR